MYEYAESEIDIQITSQLQAEEQAREKYPQQIHPSA